MTLTIYYAGVAVGIITGLLIASITGYIGICIYERKMKKSKDEA